MIDRFIIWYMQRQLNKLKKSQKTPYIYTKGIGKDYPKFLMYTDDEETRNKIFNIW